MKTIQKDPSFDLPINSNVFNQSNDYSIKILFSIMRHKYYSRIHPVPESLKNNSTLNFLISQEFKNERCEYFKSTQQKPPKKPVWIKACSDGGISDIRPPPPPHNGFKILQILWSF